ncbi:MAG: hypothetical protein E7469_07530, partial [Ruminococcaceae bacterium]|nr:hypothetical protein [Oscillospiraceae bacterium]
MNRELKQSAEKYSAKRKRRSAWKKVVAALGCVVVFCTTYALILPALTLEKETVCGLEEHTHTESCFRQLTERTDSVLSCRLPETQGHTHAAACFDVQPVCTQEETEGHVHTAACFDASPVCGSEESEGHAHGEDCYETVVTALDTQAVTCTLSEDENHTHTALCYGTWEQVCTLSEHAHTDACYAVEPQQDEAVVAVMALIDAMPTADEIEEQLAAAQTQEAYSDYGNAVAQQGRQAYDAYLALSEAQQAQVTNLDRLMESSWLWSRDTLDVKRGIEVWQVNAYQADSSHTTLLRGGSAADYGISFDFEWWSAIVVEQSASGTLYVSQVVTGQSDKRAYGPTTENGFVLLVWSTTIPFDQLDVSVGDAVSVSFDHSVSGSYNGTAYGTVTFADGAFKPHKDNTAQLDVVPGADTNGLIEVNLYDYGTNSNDLYNANQK